MYEGLCGQIEKGKPASKRFLQTPREFFFEVFFEMVK